MRTLPITILLGSFLSLSGQVDPKEVEIIRDEWGVPHIYAPTDAGVAYGLAWANAEDDFRTIQLMMLASKGMLGVHLGKSGAQVDYVTGLLGCKEVVNGHFEELSPDFINVLNGYTEGINAYAKRNSKDILVKNLFPVSARELLRGYVLQLSVMAGAGNTIRALVDSETEPIFETRGSNAFAISREKTTDEYVYLAVNSHQPLEGIGSWYEAHLVSDEGWNILGGLLPGGVTIFHGTNENLGWAHTVNYPDKIDVFQLDTDPDNDNRYAVDGRWYELEERRLKIKVRLFPGLRIGVRRKVYSSIYGPAIKNDDGVFSFKLSVLDDIRAPDQWYRMNKARNWDQFQTAMKMVAIPGFNTIYADKAGNIFYVGNGKIPHRNPRYNWQNTLPGDTSATLNGSYHPFEDLPQYLNPSSGFVFNTNHSAYTSTGFADYLDPGDFDTTMGYQLWENNRSVRFKELIGRYDKLDWEDFLVIKYDSRMPDSIVSLIDINAIFTIDPSKVRSGRRVLEIIQGWNKEAGKDDIGPAQVIIFYKHLAKKMEIPLEKTLEPYSEAIRVKPEEMLESLAYTEDHFLKYFGRVDVKLGEYQLLVRGDREEPVDGMFDVITAMHSTPYKKGRAKAYAGESYIMMIRYPEEGLPVIETVHVFGASARPGSPHYDDQMDLFLRKERKLMTLDIDEVRKNAKRIYHPE